MKVAFLTGLSNWDNNTLSPIQTSFLKSIHTSEENKLYLNFPYIKLNQEQIYKEPQIVVASLSNAMQYMLSKTNWIEKQREYLSSMLKMLKENEKVLLLTGSCGLEILRNIKLSKIEQEKIHIIAYGGVAKKTPNYKHLTLVQGRQDWITKLWIKDYDILIESNHLNYLHSSEFLKFINDYITKMEI